MTVETQMAEPNASTGESNQTPTPESPGIVQYTDGYAYEVPRPFLTVQQAASILGKSLRSIERSLLGRWGNKLPEGWVARKMRTSNGEEWRILPPPGFRVKLATPPFSEDDTAYDTEADSAQSQPAPTTAPAQNGNNHAPQQALRKRSPWKAERHTIEQPTIIIDRAEEVESLLRDLVSCQRALAEERRVHLEDLRMINQLQGSMRLLEANQNQQEKIRQELEEARKELSDWKQKYEQEVNTPWWRKLFVSTPNPKE